MVPRPSEVPPEGARARLQAELEAGIARELAREHGHLSWALFQGKLRPVALRLTDALGLGRWHPGERTIEISRQLCLEQPWGVVVEVLKHEMAHQFVHEVLGKWDEAAHGPAFQSLCERLGIDGRARGVPDAARTDEEERVLSRIAKLLALAQSDVEHEAEAAMTAAQRLMLKHNLHMVATQARRSYAFRHLGAPKPRIFEPERLLAVILQEHFFVEVIWVSAYDALTGRRGTVLEACGTPSNLDLAAYVHGFLLAAAERLFGEHRARTGASGRDRQSYQAGVMAGFLGKLNEERRAQREAGLVWVSDADLRDFYRRRHPRVTTARFAPSGSRDAREQGREAGRALVLHRPVGEGPGGGAPRLLGPRR